MLKALIFDVDGTLAETEELHRVAFNEAFAHFEMGWHWSREIYKELLKTTGGKERIQKFAEDSGETISPETLVDIHKWKTNDYVDKLRGGKLSLRPGIRELMSKAQKKGIRIAVATTTNLPNVEALAEACFGKPVGMVFDEVAAGDMVAKKKPAPDVYKLVLQKLNLQASECIALEDTLNGVNAAKSAGVGVILSQSVYSKGEEVGEADFVIDEFTRAQYILNL